jgi:Na+-driven multidrug efflux pump
VGPILAQNLGAGNFDRVRRGFNAALLFAGVVIIVVSVVLFALRDPIADLFSATGLTRELVYLFCGPLALLFFFNGALFISNAAFNNLGHPFFSTGMNWGRNTVAMVPMVWIGGALFGATGVLVGQALAGVLFGAIAWVLALRVIAAGGAPKASVDSFAREGRLLSLLNLRK